MEQVKTFYRRYRWLFLAAAYLVVFAVGVLYLRVTISIPPEGDDKLTLNRWMYDFQRMPFWQYLLQDLQGRLRYFTLQEVRFFPFHYPNAVALLFYGSLSHYRLYIIAWTGAAAFLVSRVAARFGSGDALALGGFTLAMAAAPIWNEGMYSYYAVPQRALFWAMAAWLCLFGWENSHRRGWAAAAALLSFVACGTYEIGYMFAALAFVVWCLRARSVKAGLFNTAPALGGMGVALIFHMLCGRSGGTGNEVSLDIPQVLRVLVQQMAASIPGLNSRILQEDCGVLSNGDRLWPLVLGVLAGLLLFFAVPREKLNRKMLGAAAGFGLAVWALPALLLALSARYQAPGAITWKWGYIPAAASSIGFALVVAVLLAALAGACRKLPQILSILARLGLTAALAAGLCLNGSYLRGVVRTHHAENLDNYQFFVRTIQSGLADAVQPGDLILCNENVWDSNADAETAFFSRFTGRDLHAAVLGTTYDAPAGNTYAYQTYRKYGGYDLAWCGRLQSADSDLMDGVQVYVQSACVPDNAVIKYKVRLADGTEEARAICLLDCTQTPRDANGDYLATVEDSGIVNAKLMIWDG
ncbi:hypothetical protein [Gemmiger sp.]|uniref:hypothetical protein n=1 Tax=Gemmiger sp. TaxID=2049027 RepID=UPI0025DD1592|nr:hypothetical protein [uncultured Gemmiger sp.]